MDNHVTFTALMDWLLFAQRPTLDVTTHVPNCEECICRFRLVQRMTSYSEQKTVHMRPEPEWSPPRAHTV